MSTLHDVRNDCLTILFQKNYMEESDFKNISFVTNGGEKLKNIAISKALEQLEKASVVTKCEVHDDEDGSIKNYWILDKSASQLNQNVEISAGIANLIFQVAKTYSQVFNSPVPVDPNNITERDIQFLCIACAAMMEEIIEDEDKNLDDLDEETEE